MHPPSPQITNVTPIPHPQPDIHHVMYRIDQLAIETHKLREEMRAGFAQVHGEFKAMRADHESFKKELADQRLEYTKEFGQCRAEFQRDLNTSREKFNGELSASRAEFRAGLNTSREKFNAELSASRAEFRAGLNTSRAEFKEELQKMHEKSRKDFDEMLVRTKIDMKELVASVVATVDDRIRMSGQASDLRLLKWCARAAISSSAAAGSLAYAVSKFLP